MEIVFSLPFDPLAQKQAYGYADRDAFKLLSHMADFHETWHRHFASRGHYQHHTFNFVQYVVTTCRTHGVVRRKAALVPPKL
jgi:hypothetical protein